MDIGLLLLQLTVGMTLTARNLVLRVAALSVAFTGPGTLSIDAPLGYSPGGITWGTGALVVVVLGAAVQLAQRRVPPVSEHGDAGVAHSASEGRQS